MNTACSRKYARGTFHLSRNPAAHRDAGRHQLPPRDHQNGMPMTDPRAGAVRIVGVLEPRARVILAYPSPRPMAPMSTRSASGKLGRGMSVWRDPIEWRDLSVWSVPKEWSALSEWNGPREWSVPREWNALSGLNGAEEGVGAAAEAADWIIIVISHCEYFSRFFKFAGDGY